MSTIPAQPGAVPGGQDAAVLSVRDLRTYLYTSRGVVKAVDGLTFTIRRGEILGVVGESGSGKTMTALSIIRLLPEPPARIVGGEVVLDGVDLTRQSEDGMRRIRGRDISIIFQDPLTSLNPLMKVGTQVGEVVRAHRNVDSQESLRRAIETLELVGIPEPSTRASQYPFELSGGMRQRVMIAIAIASRPKLVIADEPTTNLDATIQAQILSLLRKITEQNRMSMMLITHNLGIAAWVCQRVAVMYAGNIVELGPTSSILKNPLHPYTQALLKSVPRIDSQRGKLYAIPGDVPKMIGTGTLCKFNPRCPHARQVCREKDPYLIEAEPGHFVNCFIYGKEWAVS